MVAAKAVSGEIMSEIKEIVDRKMAVIVEGRKDKTALEGLGISGSSIFVLNKKPLFVVAEAVAKDYKAVAILTDLDAEGRKLYGKLNTMLQHLGVKVDNNFRNFLFKSTQLRQIEGLSTLVKEFA